MKIILNNDKLQRENYNKSATKLFNWIDEVLEEKKSLCV